MSGASTLRNAVKRVTHKERAQPSDRKKFGLLEKHKDYIERARDFQRKQKYITNLRNKALDKNPDEFYFQMHNSRLQKGKHVNIKKSQLDQETINLLKSQDLGYITYKRSQDAQKIQKLKENIHLIGAVAPKKHTIFVDSEEDVEHFDASEHFDTQPELVDRVYNRPRTSQLEEALEKNPNALNSIIIANENNAKKRKRSKEMQELKERSKRTKKLTSAMNSLTMQRNLATAKGARKKITVTKVVGKAKKEKEMTVYKWKRERTR